MKTKILILLFAMAIFNACNKDKYQNKPVLTLKSVSTTNLPAGGSTTFNIEITDKKGNIIGDTVFYWKKVSFISDTNNIAATAVAIPPDLPGIKRFDALFELMLSNSNLQGAGIAPATVRKINDSCVIKFWMKDLSNNVSDTLVSPIITIQHS